MNDENTGLQVAEPVDEAPNDGDLWQIGWKLLDLHKAVHDLARAKQDEADASASLALASGRVLGTRLRIDALKAELAELEPVNG